MRAALLGLPLALAACGGESTPESAARTGEVSLKNTSVSEVAEQTAAATKGGAVRFQPGEWETVVEVLDASIPDMPRAIREQMKQVVGGRVATTRCMTSEEAARPTASMFTREADSCRFDEYRMRDGRIDATMMCQRDPDDPGTARVTMVGRYSPTSFELRNTLNAEGGPQGSIAIRSRVTGRRLGECA